MDNIARDRNPECMSIHVSLLTMSTHITVNRDERNNTKDGVTVPGIDEPVGNLGDVVFYPNMEIS